ncbi:hypothetical protein V6S67_18090 [Arthrobacter sp. Soc17.1.1.1]|uniref:hypothetical protein n=1 Tax=Arthrobacter sp. Soc17.1.1.1 TaxID=3121277 RepID=UPI002FE4B255
MTSIVRAPGNLIVATIEKVDVRFAGVDVTKAPLHVDVPLGTPCVVVYLSAVRGYETVSHDAEIAQTRSREDLAAEAEEAQNDGPPKLSNLDTVGVTITDDEGTQYEPSGFRMVGDGLGWDDMRVYTPAPPSAAATLHLDFTVDGESTNSGCDVALSPC